MSFLSRIFRRKEVSKAETETKNLSTPEIVDLVQSKVETESPRVETETIGQILLKLTNLESLLRQHDMRISGYLVELLTQRKLITPEKKKEVEEVIKEALRENIPKSEVIDKLQSLGVPRSSAFKYAKPIQSKPETENLQPETETE
jgi:agmatine/peptidylarginine deiminase